MVIKNKKVLRAFALCLVGNFVFNIVLPLLDIGVSNIYGRTHAIQNAGITPPRIVDLKSGDMNYSVPFIGLPGGYNFELSYKAGISPMQNSSWVGLGWQMDAGEISRTVNGYADDYAGPNYENYYFGATLPSTPTKQYKPYGCLQGYKMTLGKTVGTDLPDNFTFDTYVSHYPDVFSSTTYNTIPSGTPNPTYTSSTALTPGDSYFGGSFPNYDGYQVSGGGMSGFMQPLILENPTLYHSNRTSWLNTRSSVIRKLFTQSKPNFRFVNDFSNYYKTSSVASFTPDNSTLSNMSINFGTNQLGYNYTTDISGFDFSTRRVAGSKHVEYYTNAEIADATANGAKAKGFIGYEGMPNTTARNTASFAGGTYSYSVQDQIGAYSITDANGVTYHYALPVYAYKRYDYTKTPDAKEMANEIAQAYAYKWLLTSITGSDFVDKNNNGYADESDWGGWTNFVYGRWTDQFNERNPIAGNHKTQSGAEVYSTIKKEQYYLDAAYTRTHATLFAKESRTDANGIGSGTSLRLRTGTLFTVDGIKTIRSLMGFSSSTIYGDIKAIKEVYSTSGYNTVLDVTDLQNISTTSATYATLIVQQSRLNQDYSLCMNAATSAPGTGKLTLNSVSYFGRNGSQLSPNCDFYYDVASPVTDNVKITSTYPGRTGAVSFQTTPVNFNVGDFIKFTISSVTYHATLVQYIGGLSYSVVFLGPNIPSYPQEDIWVTATVTKNPPYTEGFYDVWGNFKSDLPNVSIANVSSLQNKDRKTSSVSGLGVDAWSLRRISTTQGAVIDVEYESDTYSDIAATEGKRVLNVHPHIGVPYTNPDYCDEDLGWDGAYCFGFSFSMGGVNQSLTSHSFKLNFLEEDAASAIANNVVVGQTVPMSTISQLYMNGGGGNLVTKSSNVIVTSKGTNANGVGYITVTVPRNDLPDGLPFVDNGPDNYGGCFHIASYIIIDNKKMLRYGGGVRVKSVSIKENDANSSFKTTYDYNVKSLANTSGSISYDPAEYDIISKVAEDLVIQYPWVVSMPAISFSQFQEYKALYARLMNPFESIRYFAPPPSVNYEYVTVKNYGNGVQENTYDEYQYSVFRNSMVKRDVPVSQAYISSNIGIYNGGYDKINRYNVRSDFRDLTSQAGLLLSVKTFDLQDKVISKRSYKYSTETTIPSDQGIVGQVFHEQRKGTLVRDVTTSAWVQQIPSWCPCIPMCPSCPPVATYVTTTTTYKDEYTYTIVSSFQRYPTVLLKVESTDYLKGLSDNVEYKRFDIFNGSPTDIITRDSYGNVFKRKIVPAYSLMDDSGTPMRLKMKGGSNMIAQTGAEYVHKVDPLNYDMNLSTISAKVTRWSPTNTHRVYNSGSGSYDDVQISDDPSTVQLENCMKPESQYIWTSPQLTTEGSFNVAPFATYVDPQGWVINSNFKKVIQNKMSTPWTDVISSSDVNDNLSSIKLTKKKSLVLAEASTNTSYNSFTFTSFEDYNDENAPLTYSYLDGEIAAGASPAAGSTYSRSILAQGSHTGKYACQVVPGNAGPGYTTKAINGNANSLQPGKTYRASVWMHENSNSGGAIRAAVNGSTSAGAYNQIYTAGISQAALKAGNWYLVHLDFDIPADYLSTGGTTNKVEVSLITGAGGVSYFDDFSFHPLESEIKGYVYDELTWQLNYTLDKDNLYTRYEYDNNGRLKSMYKETRNGEVKVKDYKYNIVK